MEILKCNKTQLYRLVKDSGITVSSFGKCEFEKAYRARDYWLRWEKAGVDFEVFLSACMGMPLLSVELTRYDKDGEPYKTIRNAIHLDAENLKARGMVEVKQ